MNRMKITTGVVSILALALILAACSTPTVVAPPTPDIPAIRTESVQTVVAKLTIEAALNPTTPPEPSATAVPPAAPTEAPTATLPPVLVPTATQLPTLAPVSGGSGGVPAPTRTRRAGPDQALYITQSPSDGTVYKPGTSFDATWTFKNIGTSKWTTGYEYRFYDGTNLSNKTVYQLKEIVDPGGSTTLVVDMVAPPSAGRYVSNWELTNDNGDVFYQFYVVIDVR